MRKKKNYALERIRAMTYKGAVDKVAFKALREKTRLTQGEAAMLAGLTVQRWSDLENGRHKNPRVLTLVKVAQVLGCKVDDLLRK